MSSSHSRREELGGALTAAGRLTVPDSSGIQAV